MLAIKVPLSEAQKTKIMLIKKKLLNTDYKYYKDKNFIYFPVKKKFSSKFEIVSIELEENKKATNLKKILEHELTEEEKRFLKTSFDIIGDIAVIEVEPELVKKQKLIAKILMKQNRQIKTVLKKAGAHEGEYRIQKTKWLLGEKKKTTIHKENGVKLFVDVDKAYFSPRLANERMRIAKLIKKGENVLVMFSGIAPFPCVLSKHSPAKRIVGIELNPVAHEIAKKNVLMNKANNVELICGDVKKIVPQLNEKYDRILMPLPKTGEMFLPYAFLVAKKGTIIHLYNFLKENEFDSAKKKVLEIAKKHKIKCEILKIVKAGQHAPYTFRVCIDIKVLEI